MKTLPEWWNIVHERALAALPSEWTLLGALRAATGEQGNVFDDLVVAVVAEVKYEDIHKGKMHIGQRIYFKRIIA